MAKTVFVTWANSESGDFFGPYVLTSRPTDRKLKKFWKDKAPCEFETLDGPGTWNSYLFVDYDSKPIEEV